MIVFPFKLHVRQHSILRQLCGIFDMNESNSEKPQRPLNENRIYRCVGLLKEIVKTAHISKDRYYLPNHDKHLEPRLNSFAQRCFQ